MYLCFDLGASKIRIGLVDKGKVIMKRVKITPKKKADILRTLYDLIGRYDSFSSIKGGVASFIKDGVTCRTCNMDFADVALKKLLRARYKVSVYVDNDANCAGLGELVYGHGREINNFVLLTLGTGIGGAVVINHKLYRGQGFAGEPGQMIIDGQRLEDLVSGNAILRQAKKIGLKVSIGEELKELADAGNERALKIYKKAGEHLGRGILNIAYMLDPEAFIVGGGLSKVDYLLSEAKKFLHASDVIQRKISLLKAKLGDNVGLIGASLLAEKKYFFG